MQRSLTSFPEKQLAKNIYLTKPETFERMCRECTELVNMENAGVWVRIHCKTERCVK